MKVWASNHDMYDPGKLFAPQSIHFENLFIMEYQYEHCGCEMNSILFFDLSIGNMKLKIYYDYVPDTCMNDPEYRLYKIYAYIHDSNMIDTIRSIAHEQNGLSMDLCQVIMDYVPPKMPLCLYYNQQTYKHIRSESLFRSEQPVHRKYVSDDTFADKFMLQDLIGIIHRFLDSKEMMAFMNSNRTYIEEDDTSDEDEDEDEEEESDNDSEEDEEEDF